MKPSVLMEDMLTEAAKQVPSLAVLCVVVWIFIRHLESTGTSWRKAVEDIQKENMEARTASRETIRENSACARENTIAMTQLTAAVEHLAKK